MSKLIKKFIEDNNLSKFKKSDINIGSILEDENGDKMLITRPAMTENLIIVIFDDFIREYQYKKGLDNEYNWFILKETSN